MGWMVWTRVAGSFEVSEDTWPRETHFSESFGYHFYTNAKLLHKSLHECHISAEITTQMPDYYRNCSGWMVWTRVAGSLEVPEDTWSGGGVFFFLESAANCFYRNAKLL